MALEKLRSSGVYFSFFLKTCVCFVLLIGSMLQVNAGRSKEEIKNGTEEPQKKKVKFQGSPDIVEPLSNGSLLEMEDLSLEDMISFTSKCESFEKGTQALFHVSVSSLLDKFNSGDMTIPAILGTVGYVMVMYPKLIGMEPQLDECFQINSLTINWLNQAYSNGDSSIEDHLGFCYLKGCGTKINITKGLQLFKRSAERDIALLSKPISTSIPMSSETAFILRLVGVETGRDKFIYGDEDVNIETLLKIIDLSNQEVLPARCLLLHSIILGRGWKTDQHSRNQMLECLATINLPVAQWLTGRIFLNQADADRGLHYIFQAASAGCPQAMLFINSSFGGEPEHHYESELYSNVMALNSSLEVLKHNNSGVKEKDRYKDIFDLQQELSTLFKLLLDVQPRFIVNCEALDPQLRALLKELKSPEFVFYHETHLTLGEYNEVIMKQLLSFLKNIEEKFSKGREALEKRLSDYDTILTQKKRKLTNPEEIKQIEEKINSRKEKRKSDIILLDEIKNGIKNLFP